MEPTNTFKPAQERIENMPARLNSVLHAIIPHLNESMSGAINKIGIVSVVTGGTNAVVTTALETQDPTWLTISNSVAIFSIVGSVMFIIKLAVDIYFARRKDQREQEEHEKRNQS